MSSFDTDNYRRIPYEEYKAIGELMHAHLKTHEGQLRAMVAFGDILTRGGTYNIDLLEVVENWQGPKSVVFGTSAELPLRGQLRLYLLTPEEFERPESFSDLSNRSLVERVREGYDVIYENPSNYARDILARSVIDSVSDDPLRFLVAGNSARPQ